MTVALKSATSGDANGVDAKTAALVANDRRTTDEDENDDDNDPGTLKQALLKICEETSFQGVPFIVAPTPFPLRR